MGASVSQCCASVLSLRPCPACPCKGISLGLPAAGNWFPLDSHPRLRLASHPRDTLWFDHSQVHADPHYSLNRYQVHLAYLEIQFWRLPYLKAAVLSVHSGPVQLISLLSLVVGYRNTSQQLNIQTHIHMNLSAVDLGPNKQLVTGGSPFRAQCARHILSHVVGVQLQLSMGKFVTSPRHSMLHLYIVSCIFEHANGASIASPCSMSCETLKGNFRYDKLQFVVFRIVPAERESVLLHIGLRNLQCESA